MRYLPYGQERWNNGASVTDFGFTSQRNEASFGLMDYNARYYSPVLGRFISPDSLVPDPTSSSGFNRYRYTRNNPLKYTDPSGHQDCSSQNAICKSMEYIREIGEDLIEKSETFRKETERSVDEALDVASQLGEAIPEADGYVIGVEVNIGPKRLPFGIGKFLQGRSIPVNFSAPRGAELVLHNESGEMDIFVNLGPSFDPVSEDYGGGIYGSIYGGAVYNLDSIQDYEQTYERFDFTVARGPFGGTIKAAGGTENNTVVVGAGWSVGTAMQGSYQRLSANSSETVIEFASDSLETITDFVSDFLE